MAEMRSRNTEIARSGWGEFTDRICVKNFYTKTSQISNSRMQTYSVLLRQAGLAILVHPTDGSLPPTTARMVFGNPAWLGRGASCPLFLITTAWKLVGRDSQQGFLPILARHLSPPYR